MTRGSWAIRFLHLAIDRMSAIVSPDSFAHEWAARLYARNPNYDLAAVKSESRSRLVSNPFNEFKRDAEARVGTVQLAKSQKSNESGDAVDDRVKHKIAYIWEKKVAVEYRLLQAAMGAAVSIYLFGRRRAQLPS